MYVYCLWVALSKCPNLEIFNIFVFKICVFLFSLLIKPYNNQDRSKTENSGGENALVFKNIWGKFLKP